MDFLRWFLLALAVLLSSNPTLAYHHDYVYDIVLTDHQQYHNKEADRIAYLESIVVRDNDIPAVLKGCKDNRLSSLLRNLTSPEFNISPGTDFKEAERKKALAGVFVLVDLYFPHYTRTFFNVMSVLFFLGYIAHLVYLYYFTWHYTDKMYRNPRLLDGSSIKGQRPYVFFRPKWDLWDYTGDGPRLAGHIQKFIIWRHFIEGAHDEVLAHRIVDSGFHPEPGVNFHIIANVPIPELDEDELTEAQALKRRIKKIGILNREQFRYNVEQIHARRLVLAAAKEYQRRIVEKGHEPLFDPQIEAQESMDYALTWSRLERIRQQEQLEEERRERDRTIDVHWEKSSKTFRHQRRRMRAHEAKIAEENKRIRDGKIQDEQNRRQARGLPLLNEDQIDFLF